MTRPVLTELDGSQIIGNAELKTEVLNSAYTLIPLQAGFTNGGVVGGDLRVKRIGNVCFVSGLVLCTLGGTTHVNAPFGTVPVGFRPVVDTSFYHETGTTTPCRLDWDTSGAIVAAIVSNGATITFGYTYEAAP